MKTFHEKNMHTALQKIRDELGENAVIVSTNENTYGVEVTAATDYESAANGDVSVEISQDIKNKSYESSNQKFMYEPSTNANEVKVIKDEISQLRSMIESQTELISWNRIIKENDNARKLLQKLSVAGFSYGLSKALLDAVHHEKDLGKSWKIIEKSLQSRVSILDKNILDEGGIVSLVGPTGVGKTTTIAKLASQYALKHKSSDIALISTDHYRIGAHDQISIYGRILNVPVIAASDKHELGEILNQVKNKSLVLIDTVGFGQRDSRVNELTELLLSQEVKISNYLVIAANSQLCVQKEVINKYLPGHIDGVVITKTDEALQMGGVLSCLIQEQLDIAFETNGQRVPEDLLRSNVNELLEKTFTLGEQYGDLNSIHSTDLYSGLIENDL